MDHSSPEQQRSHDHPAPQQLALQKLADTLGAARVVTDPGMLTLFSQDVFRRGETVLAILQPETLEELAETVRCCAEGGLSIVPRGGGMSYTDGIVPVRPDSVSLDLTRLNRIIRIDEADMTVTVEAGVTWQALREALAARGLRTPYWGPMSGLRATVGGALSQGSIFFGSASHGAVGDSVLSLTVVTGDGTIIETASGASRHVQVPFFRWYGPDLTGLFLGDCGALGIKARATFRLLKLSRAEAYLSFSFASYSAMSTALAAITRESVCSEIAAFDPFLARLRLKRASLMADVGALGAVVKSSGSLLQGMAAAAKVALAGRGFLDEEAWSIHCTLDGLSQAALAPALALVRDHAATAGGREVENTIARMMRAMPFPPPNSMLAPGGERWVPVHGIVPLSKMAAAMAACEAVFADHAGQCAAFRIEHGYLMTTIASHAFLIEPCLYWPDAANEWHEASMEPDYFRRLPRHPPCPAGFAAVTALKDALARALSELGASHFQLGKFYPYAENLRPGARQLLSDLKTLLDPKGVLNPGALGLD
jgi:D-lactate dehydrogenase (cytochrome)